MRFCRQIKRYIFMVAKGEFKWLISMLCGWFHLSIGFYKRFKNPNKNWMGLWFNLGVFWNWKWGMPAGYAILRFTKLYEMPVVLLAFQLLSGCLALTFGIAKSNGVRNPFSAIKCKKEKACIDLGKVTNWTYVFKLFWTSLQIISICTQSFCDIITQCSKRN